MHSLIVPSVPTHFHRSNFKTFPWLFTDTDTYNFHVKWGGDSESIAEIITTVDKWDTPLTWILISEIHWVTLHGSHWIFHKNNINDKKHTQQNAMTFPKLPRILLIPWPFQVSMTTKHYWTTDYNVCVYTPHPPFPLCALLPCVRSGVA